MFTRAQPYNDLPLLPPHHFVETTAVLKAAARAHRRLAELKGRTNTVPNPTILLNTIALQEAKMSSEIENIFTTNDELYRGMSLETPGRSPHAKEVLHYNDALWHGAETLKLRPILSANLAVEIANMIKENDAGIRRQSGTQLINPVTKDVIYTPPEGEERIRKLLHNFEQFANNNLGDDLDPLVKMAIVHYQFEAIHPFYDGNGRTGRILLILFLLLEKLLDQPILFLSRYIIENKAEYYRLLRNVTERSEWEPWIIYLLKAVESTALQTCEKIAAISDLLAEMVEDARRKLPSRIFSKELVEQLFVRPYCKIRFLVEAGLGQRVAVARYLRALEKADLVRTKKVVNEVLFINYRLVDLLGQTGRFEGQN